MAASDVITPAILCGGICLVLFGTGPVHAQGQQIAPGVYACDGRAQTGPCNLPGDAANDRGNDAGGVIGYAYAAPRGFLFNHVAVAVGPRSDGTHALGVADTQKFLSVPGSGAPPENEAMLQAAADRKALADCAKDGGRECKLILQAHHVAYDVFVSERNNKAYVVSRPLPTQDANADMNAYRARVSAIEASKRDGKALCERQEGEGGCTPFASGALEFRPVY